MNRDKEISRIREMRKEYDAMPSFINGARNMERSDLYKLIEMRLKILNMHEEPL